ncbi:TPA: hypothetical protein MM158_005209 [Klebsiella pneumoniae]|nr:hypothetical protein [Klebsiella pneumoniae]
MSNYIVRTNTVQLLIMIALVIMCISWSLASFYDASVYHPLRDIYQYITQWVYSNFFNGGTLPTEFAYPVKEGLIGVVDLAMGAYAVTYATLKIGLTLGRKLLSYLERKVLVHKFGHKKYIRYCKLRNSASIYKKNISEGSDFEKAQINYYEKWKQHYKSSLSYSEWQKKVLNTSKPE